MKAPVAWMILVLAVPALCSCERTAQDDARPIDDITAVVFIERDQGNAHFVNSVKDPARIQSIITGIAIGRESMTAPGSFRRHVVFLRGQDECLRISFDCHGPSGRYLLRYRARQYETSKETYDLLASYFPAG